MAALLDMLGEEGKRDLIKLAGISVTLLFAVGVQIIFFSQGLEAYPQAYLSLFYIPMILASYYMPKYGPFQALLIGTIPFVVAYGLYSPGIEYAIYLLVWLILFVIIGWMIAYLVINSEKTREKLQEASQELKENKDLLDTALWGAGLGVWEHDYRDGSDTVDARWRSLIGYGPKDDLPSDVFSAHVHPEFQQQYQNLERQLRGGELDNGKLELKLHRKSGEEMWARIYMTVNRDQDGQVIRLVGVLEDITSSIVQQMAVVSANEKLNILSSITRHDILNEITAAQGYLGLLDLDGYILPDTKSYDYLKKVNDSIDNIVRQMEFTRLYQDIGAKAPEWHNIPDKIKKMAVRPEFQSLDVKVDCPVEVLADPLFMNVFYNLLENTVRHGGDARTVKVTYGHGQAEGVIVYQDDGVGIPDSAKERIFERGYGKGTGYGLFVIKEILDLTDIKIKEVGVEGKGARFEIAVPLANIRRL